jgi:hypothetical protein
LTAVERIQKHLQNSWVWINNVVVFMPKKVAGGAAFITNFFYSQIRQAGLSLGIQLFITVEEISVVIIL